MSYIVDAHAHLGFDEVFDEVFTVDELLRAQDENGIAVTLVQPSLVHDLESVKRYHDAIADLCAAYPGRFYGIANPNPHLPGDTYEREIERAIKDLGFKGIKIHPFAHAVNPQSRHGRRVFDAARTMQVPVMVHTGAGIPWSCPSLIEPIAEAYPDLSIILAHAGSLFASEALRCASRHESVYLESSWQSHFILREFAQKLDPRKIMFGSDHADNAGIELYKIRSLGLSDALVSAVLGENANAVFSITP